jgi:threonine synthase
VSLTDHTFQKCISPKCGETYGPEETHFACGKCGGLLDVKYDWDRVAVPKSLVEIESHWSQRHDPLRFSGVWRFRELLPFAEPSAVVTLGEGQTLLQQADAVGKYTGLNPGCLYLQFEGMNPSGSFKDNGMSAAFTHARATGAQRAACASTGNTSASLAMYCAVTRLMKAVIFIGSGKISFGKLSQALDYGALTVQITGDFDDAMARVKEVSKDLGIYLVNSINPFRLEGQKAIMFRVLEALRWQVPDWIVVPGGNLGNSSAFGKAFTELLEVGLIDRIPRLAVINASGANTLYELHERRGMRWNGGQVDEQIASDYYAELAREQRKAETIASAIEINRPVNLSKCLRALEVCDGVVREVSDQEILDAKAQVGAGGIGCEPASAASVAGARMLRREGIIGATDRTVCILTGHLLKDPTATVAYHTTDQKQFNEVLGSRGVKRASFANRAVAVPNDRDEIIKEIHFSCCCWGFAPRTKRLDRGTTIGRIAQRLNPSMALLLAINGAAGRMGRRLIALGTSDPELQIGAALERAEHPDLGKDAGVLARVDEIGVELSDRLTRSVGALVDFSLPASALSIVEVCRQQKLPLVLATTGLGEEGESMVRQASSEIPIVWAPNMSLAVNLTMKLATQAAEVLRDQAGGADVEIIERHHHFKEDAPSGTALRFGQLIAEVMGQTRHQHGRSGAPGARPPDEIGYHALRVGDNPGEHTIVYGLMGESIELTVRSTNRDCYALGALAAAKFVAKQQPGIYAMNDVLGL